MKCYLPIVVLVTILLGAVVPVAHSEPSSLRGRLLKVEKNNNGKSLQASSKSRNFQSVIDKDDKENGYVVNVQLSPGDNIQFKSNPRKGLIQIRRIGKNQKSHALSAEDKQFLTDLADSLTNDDSIETYEVDEIGTQSERALRVLSEWPETLVIHFDYKPEDDDLREPDDIDVVEVEDTTGFPEVPPLEDGGRALTTTITNTREEHPSGHHFRRLAYVSLCGYMNKWYEVTHDCFWYNNWNDKTTYYALMSMHGSCPRADGTWFLKSGQWTCYEPDHDKNVEYAYGACFGRCGSECGSSTQFTKDCARHDSCVRFGHAMGSFWCDDEFTYAIDDTMFAPNC
jgi:hypothetical protein